MAPSLANRISDVLLRIFKTLVILWILGVLVFTFLGGTCGVGMSVDAARRAQAKNDVVQIATAVTAFQTEYNRLPGANSGVVGGELLAALVGGTNSPINPRQIVFIEVSAAKKGRSGVTNGTFVDPWGGAYQIAFANGTNTSVTAGTNHIVVPRQVAVWNDPRLQNLKRTWFFTEKPRSSYVTSWQ